MQQMEQAMKRYQEDLYQTRRERDRAVTMTEKTYSRLRVVNERIIEREEENGRLMKTVAESQVVIRNLVAGNAAPSASKLADKISDRIRMLEGHACPM